MQDLIIPVPSKAKGIIFDLDGTLVDSMPMHYDAYNHCLEPWDVVYPKELFLSRAGIPSKDTLLLIEEENGIVDFDVEVALQRKRDYVTNNLNSITLIEPMFEVVKACHGKLPMSIGTGSHRAVVDEIYGMFEFDKYIPHSISATEVENFKPHPETFIKCAELMGIAPADCVVYEDGVPGMESARTAGMQLIDVREFL